MASVVHLTHVRGGRCRGGVNLQRRERATMVDERVPFVIAGAVDAIDRLDQHVRIGSAVVWLGPATSLEGVVEGTHVCIAGHREGERWIAEEILRPRSRP